jgi:hypothetical protein
MSPSTSSHAADREDGAARRAWAPSGPLSVHEDVLLTAAGTELLAGTPHAEG